MKLLRMEGQEYEADMEFPLHNASVVIDYS